MSLDTITQLDRDEHVKKPRETRTRKTRAWRRRILFAMVGLGLAVVARRVRKRRGRASSTDDPTGGGGRSVAWKVAVVAASAAAMAAARRFLPE